MKKNKAAEKTWTWRRSGGTFALLNRVVKGGLSGMQFDLSFEEASISDV